MRMGLVAGALALGVGCAGAGGPQPPEHPAQQIEPAPPGQAEPEGPPVEGAALPLWLRPVLLVHGGTEEGGLRWGVQPAERPVRRASEVARCAAAWLERDPRPPAPLWIDLSVNSSGGVASVSHRGARPLAWPCLREALGRLSFDPPEAGGTRHTLALFFLAAPLVWGRSPPLRPEFLPRERGDAPREPREIQFDHDQNDFLWSLRQLRARGGQAPSPSTAMESLLAGHRAVELSPSLSAGEIDAARQLAERDASPAARAAARLVQARRLRLVGDPEAAARALFALVCAGRSFPQARSQQYWARWEALHPSRASLHPTASAVRAWSKARKQEPSADEPSSLDEETTFVDPFTGCAPAEGATAAMQAEAWAVLGDLHANGGAPFGGALALNRAASAYRRSLAAVDAGVVRLQLALVLQKVSGHRAASELLSGLLRERQGPAAEDAVMQGMALTALARSLLEPDFEGQPAGEPWMPGDELLSILDRQTDSILVIRKPGGPYPLASKQKEVNLGGTALAHARDPALVPPGAWFAPALLRTMGRGLFDLNQLEDALVVIEHTRTTFPLHRDAPVVAAAQREILQRKRQWAPPGSDEQARAASKLAESEEHYAAEYLSSDSPWARANRADPASLEQARALAPPRSR